MRQRLWLGIGWLFTLLAVIGIALPVLPTVPFLLVAAWAFARSSPALEQRILNHPKYGPPVRAWQQRGAVSRIAKIWAITAMCFGVGLSAAVGMPLWVVAVQALIAISVGAFLITRPEE
ncbi:YbaN family protein [Paracoccus sp. 1_MG-2023]|uniref:YbaN family protein n=1 Tax=unclassified Paracoccus (in: a-proteobacteria) TaxID=2688777 RepID=UPI001C096DF1|nr:MULTISPECIES: YbaN family protein [unclassified Paracoccus (in: a-proteobacteria)]MBU2957247.1 YbaN family protein [Paracoccus sp. C2R09]MDO6669134.1 YbaN family protein [Paracoccus sp. 1_MG-2023]